MLDTNSPSGDHNWQCYSVDSDGNLNCDSVVYPRADGLLPVRFFGTWDLHVQMRVFNYAGSFRITSPYRIEVQATARDWLRGHDTGYVAATGVEFEYSEYVTHTWYNLTLGPADLVTLKLMRISRQTSSFWPDFNLQLTRIWLTLNSTLEPDGASGYASWLYGEYASPLPPPPPLRQLIGFPGR